MSQRRMLSNRIANSAKFLQMPVESQLLYFHMILRADDDGIVECYPIMRLLGIASDNYKVLLAKGFIRQLNEDQVIVIIDWFEHNTIRADRKIDSIYLPLLLQKYPELPVIEPKPRADTGKTTETRYFKANGQPMDNQKREIEQMDSISKVKLSKVKLISLMTESDFLTFYQSYPRHIGKKRAQDKFLRLKRDLLPIILAAIEKQKQTRQWQEEDGKYIPHPITWLNQERWEDEIKEETIKEDISLRRKL